MSKKSVRERRTAAVEMWRWKKSGDHQLSLVVFPIIYKVLAPSQVVVWDFFHQQYVEICFTESGGCRPQTQGKQQRENMSKYHVQPPTKIRMSEFGVL